MGAWGTGISSNDTFADIYASFFEQYNDGADVPEITASLINTNQEIINNNFDCNNFWFAIAKAQWECKALGRSVYSKVENIINSGADILIWQQLAASEKDIKKRKAVLTKFISELQTERLKPKARKKKIIREPAFLKGDCITFKLENGNYGGAVILEAIHNSEYAYNLVATTSINQLAKPVKTDFKNAQVLILTFAAWDEKPEISWILPLRYKNVKHLFEKVDTIAIEPNYDINALGYKFSGDFDKTIIASVNRQMGTTNPESGKKITIKQLSQKNKFKFW